MKNFDQVKHLNNNGDVEGKSELDDENESKRPAPAFWKRRKDEPEITQRVVQLKENTEGLKTMDGSNKTKRNGQMKEVRESKDFLFLAT